ncbi:alpha/beta fold hydrolase [Amorphoplanes digitatis]|uniref:Pimeloyl-ACP methyl ester carboxylesterase n=1 Tax=Actinoplanes digitatis TaxID=1868 RepID=A0A7W7I0Q8_9ACTN|nr:alpha/beta fold hydrolase [Actinoplanes digitatis]MBB4764292.1 pimeloyl-ACP methyl ester carboxylesterase [Actinoplanes digitatis]GID96315.1 hydrolase [Actinoplanes digitatis]
MHRDPATVPTSAGPVVVHRSGSGPAVVLLHANPGDSRDFSAVLPALSEHFTVYAVDWPGYGQSPPPQPPSSATAMGYALLVPQVLNALGIEHAAFIGNSVGGYCAVRFALEHPGRVRALVLVNSGGFTRPTPPGRAFVRVKGTEAATRLLAGRLSRRYLRRRNRTVAEMLARDDARRDDPAAIAVEAAIWRSFNDPAHDLRAAAGGLTVATLLAWGTRDPLLGRDGRRARRLLPHATWSPLPTGHAPYAEAPGEFLAVALPFLRRHTRAGA